ncbi:DUF1993 domain-containing protein [Aliiglaciecola sp. CAU 1673]|uniref:DUF1993 domain-containing protein n=1 Tax=Aliiglaciecola sp. CAU 1673 TaxID=3032595 RepID=UPI0023DCC58F|nr:DUF1993 domain-containing protein [Aliiglaciecola sp. CAU 1673]MDF2179672.1 DUF1993 domain-containing protein [Aliiglaciecola sp. CAU 1673]
MSLSMFNASVPVLLHSLANLKAILDKAEAFATAKKVDSSTIAGSRLAIDMLPLSSQIQIACDTAKGCGARLAGVDIPRFEDNEKSLAELKVRIERTMDFLSGITAEQVDGGESKAIVLNFPSITLNFNGQDYLTQFVLPNFFFHVTTAYGILRHLGVEIGKIDYLGKVGV